MKEINRILIANRGEIAFRITRAARELGISTVAVYSDLDGPDAFHCKNADRSFPLHGTALADTYLDIQKIISIAKLAGVQAIHPGYGFLSENHLFAESCEKNGLVFIGPPARLIRLMGNKIQAREAVGKLGVPVIRGAVSSAGEILESAGSIGYPVLLKAAAGGGGKGMRIVETREALENALETTSREAQNYFGNGDIFLEKYLDPARHIEFQILADHHGNVIHVFERECSIQRRYQKIIEECPSSWLLPETRQRMGGAAVRIARELGYTSAGTIEFLVDENQQFYFLEMNTRIQVEHPVTEMVSGIDLVREQIRIAQGISLEHKQEEIHKRGHAIEARIYAEDPLHQFRPSPGQVAFYSEPEEPSVRMDSSLDGPSRIFPEYDPMISKLIAWGEDRKESVNHLLKGLRNYAILGIQTNKIFLQEILQDADFLADRISTRYCDLRMEHLTDQIRKRQASADRIFYISAFVAGTLMGGNSGPGKENYRAPWHAIGYWRQHGGLRFMMGEEKKRIELLGSNLQMLRFRYEDEEYEISGVRLEGGKLRFLLDGEPRKAFYAPLATGEEIVEFQGINFTFKRWDALPDEPALRGSSEMDEHNERLIVSPINGKILKINVKESDIVDRGDILAVIDSMKMENNITAPGKAKIARIMIEEGDQVEMNMPVIEIE